MTSGWIDVHSHLLPAIDDGCFSLEESLTCVRRLLQQGFVGTICTPHMIPKLFPFNTPATIRRKVAHLREQLRGEGLDYQLWAGGELRIDPGALEWIQRVGVPTLGDGRCVLMDYWGAEWPEAGDRLCEWLIQNGYQPILAHPERMGLDDAKWPEVRARLRELGVWLQSNLASMSGHEGDGAGRQVRELLRDDACYALALDMHGPETLDVRFLGMTRVIEEMGLNALQRWLADRPREILGIAPS